MGGIGFTGLRGQDKMINFAFIIDYPHGCQIQINSLNSGHENIMDDTFQSP